MKWIAGAGGALLLTVTVLSEGSGQAPSGRDFPVVGGNLANQRYSSLTGINKKNIAQLGAAWTRHLEGGKTPATMQATPVVVDGVLYISSGAGNIFAIDGATGDVKWKYETTLGGNSRGVAVDEGRVFSGKRDNQLIALDHFSICDKERRRRNFDTIVSRRA